MAKPSEKYSIVPEFIRDKFRKYKEQEREAAMEQERKNSENAPPANTLSESDRRALDELVAQTNASDDQTNSRGFKKGGMVKKKTGGVVSKKSGGSVGGAGIAQRGLGKMRML
jgi:hypothetical protein